MHENAVTLVAAGLLVLVLATLVLSRYGALYSIKDIANINPLITRANVELIAVNVNGVIKIIKDEDPSTPQSENNTSGKTTGSQLAQSPGANTGPTGNNTNGSTAGGTSNPSNGGGGTAPGTGGNTGGSSTGGGGSSGGGSSTATFKPVVSSLALNIGEPKRSGGGILGPLICRRDYTFTAQLKANSGSGKVTLSWVLDGSTKDSVSNIELDARNPEKTFTYTANISTYGPHVFKASIPGSSQEKEFNHSC